jgi:Mg/Co/Ni transporter MgtE
MSNTTTHRKGGSKGANGYGEYQVRYASDKQKKFIEQLLATKNHSYNNFNINDLNVQGAGEIINALLSCDNKAGVVIPPTERQVQFAQSLVTSKEGGQELLANVLQSKSVNSLEQLSRGDVSAIINSLKVAKVKEVVIKISEVGAYLLDETIYSIRLGQESKKWQVWSYDDNAKKYQRNDKEVEKNVLEKVDETNRLTLDQAIKYSAQTGICCHCGRTLTVLKSVAGGIGPICAKRYH